VSIRYRRGTARLALRGTIAEKETSRLRSLLVEAFVCRRPRRLLIDVGTPTTLDPTAVGALIAAAVIAPEQDVDFRVQCRDRQTAVELTMVGLTPDRPS